MATLTQCKMTPGMIWQFRRNVLGGKSAVTGAPLPERLEDCPAGVQEDHYAQACYVHGSTQLTTSELLEQGTNLLLAVPCPAAVPAGRSVEIRTAAVNQVLADHGYCG